VIWNHETPSISADLSLRSFPGGPGIWAGLGEIDNAGRKTRAVYYQAGEL